MYADILKLLLLVEEVEKNYCDIVKVLKFSTIVENVYHEIYVEAEQETIYEIYQRNRRIKDPMNATLVAFFPLHYG